MKRLWTNDDLVAQWTLQRDVSIDRYPAYDWTGRTIKQHRADIRAFVGFREWTTQDYDQMIVALLKDDIPNDHQIEHLKVIVYTRFRALQIEPPTPDRVERLVRSALRTYEQQFGAAMHTKLNPETLLQMDALLSTVTIAEQSDDREADGSFVRSAFQRSDEPHPTYAALAELGKVRKTIFLCTFLHREELRREVHEALNVMENGNSAKGFILYGKGGEIASNRLEDQELTILSLHLLQLCLVYINTILIQNVLNEPQWAKRMTPEDLRGLTPLIYNHVNLCGLFHWSQVKVFARLSRTKSNVLDALVAFFRGQRGVRGALWFRLALMNGFMPPACGKWWRQNRHHLPQLCASSAAAPPTTRT